MIPLLQPVIRKDVIDLIGWRDPETPVKIMVVTGPNASGKSFVRRMIASACKKTDVECIALSVERRTSSGTLATMIYGDETHTPTGLITAQTIITGFNTASERNNKCLLLYDEPEIGMSEELQWASVRYMKEQMDNPPEQLQGLVVITHSRIFAKHLVEDAGATFVNMGGQYPTLESWLNRPVDINLDIQALSETSLEKFRAISKLLYS